MLMKDNLIDPNYKSDSDAQNEVIRRLIEGSTSIIDTLLTFGLLRARNG